MSRPGVAATSACALPTAANDVVAPNTIAPEFLEAARRMHLQLLEELDLRRAQVERLDAVALRQRAAQTLAALSMDTTLFMGMDRRELEQFVLDETLGLGALESLLARARRTLKAALAGEWREMLPESKD